MGKKILLVDDEADLVDFIKRYLEKNGYEVVTAGDGMEGIEKTIAEMPSLVILDVKMPRMDGFEMLRRLRNNVDTQYTPIIMLTQKRETQSLFQAQDMGSTDYIMKPFQVKELLDMVNRYILYAE